MRSFFIEEQLNSWLFDLDGNVYHPRLRNELYVGIIVGIRVLKKEILRKIKEEILELYREYDDLNQKYLKFIENKLQEI